MRIGFLSIGALLCFLMVNQASAQCLCASKGEDYCASKVAVRPVPKLLERIATAKFPPIGDTCWCGKQVVEPAVPPKPPCKSIPGPGCKHKCCNAAPPPPMPACFDDVAKPAKVPFGIPADPISIGLAMRAGKAFAVPEAKLSYGPVNVPLNGLKKLYLSQIPEEKMYALNSAVIELKRRIPKKQEIIEEEEEEEELDDVDLPTPHLTYAELGYGPEKFKNPLFLRYSNYASPSAVAAKPSLVPAACGFKPGKIAQGAKLIDTAYDYVDDCL